MPPLVATDDTGRGMAAASEPFVRSLPLSRPRQPPALHFSHSNFTQQ